MFYYLDGTITHMEQNLAVVDCGGVGYACNTTNYTLSSLRAGVRAKLYTYCNIREDAFDIFGFSTKDERECFTRLISVSGVGPKAALAILSIVSPDQFWLAVMTQDEKTLTRAAGVGKKMALRIIMELKDKAGSLDMTGGMELPGVSVSHGSAMAEAMAALTSLGYSQSEAGAALKGLDVENLPAEELVRRALRAMVTQ